MRTLQDVITAMQAGCWEDALFLYGSAKSDWQNLKQTSDFRSELQNRLLFSGMFGLVDDVHDVVFVCSWQEQLPVFLRCFTVGWTYTRILSRGVEILQRLRRYEVCVFVSIHGIEVCNKRIMLLTVSVKVI